MTQNTLRGHSVNMIEEFAAYDAMPPFFRRVFQNAALDFAVTHAIENYRSARAFLSEREAKRLWLATFRAAEDQETAETYGPDHPETKPHLRTATPAPYAVHGPGKARA